MKKVLVIFLALMLVFSFTACVDEVEEEAGGLLDAIGDYLESDEFDKAAQEAADEIEDLLR